MTAPSAVSAIAAAAAEAAPAAAEQLELMPPTRFEPGSTAHTEMVERVRRAGRPLGARNLAQKAACDLVRRLFGDPMVERARWLLHSPQTLAAELECTKREAFELQDKIRADLMRYMYAPLAATDGQGNAVAPVFHLSIGGRAAGTDGRVPWDYEGGPELAGTAQEIQQNQSLPAPLDDVSHGEVSHGEGK